MPRIKDGQNSDTDSNQWQVHRW